MERLTYDSRAAPLRRKKWRKGPFLKAQIVCFNYQNLPKTAQPPQIGDKIENRNLFSCDRRARAARV